MAKATATIREALCYQPQHAQYFAANQALFNRVVAFYFDCIQAHEGILALNNKEALTALEKLTHATAERPSTHHAAHRGRARYPGAVSPGRRQCRSGICSLLLLAPEKVADAQREARSQASPLRKKEEALQRASTRASSFMEQIGSFVCGPMEREKRLIHSAQSLDRDVLELDQGSHALA